MKRLARGAAPVFLAGVILAAGAGVEALGQERSPDDAARIIGRDTGLWALFVKGGILMPFILAASVVAVGYGIERGVALRAPVQVPERLAEKVAAALSQGGPESALSLVKGRESALALMLSAALEKLREGKRAMEEAAGAAAAYALYDMRRNVRPLGIVAGVAPLLGLLGTVWGMIQAFDTVSGGGLGKSALLAKGIAQALITTGAGLIAAIPALVAHHYFRGRAEDLVRQSEARTAAFIDRVTSQPARQEPASPQRAPAPAPARPAVDRPPVSSEAGGAGRGAHAGPAAGPRSEGGPPRAASPAPNARVPSGKGAKGGAARIDVAKLKLGGED